MQSLPKPLHVPMIKLLLSIADDKLFLGHSNSNWTGLAPILEADIAFSSLAQDDIAHAGALYELVEELSETSADDIAFGRTESEYTCAKIVTLRDNFNWAAAIARQFYCNHFDYCRLCRLSDATWKPLSNLANRLKTEQAIHVDYVNSWIMHLGTGTKESKTKIQDALDSYSADASMLFEKPEGFKLLQSEGVLAHTDDFFNQWLEAIQKVTSKSALTISISPFDEQNQGGRIGVHSKDFQESLCELQEVYLQDPTATW